MWGRSSQFWAAKQAWIAERSAYTGGVPSKGSSEWGRYRFNSKRERWARTSDFAIRGATWGSTAYRLAPIAQPPGGNVTIDSTLVADIQASLTDAARIVADTYDEQFGPAMLDVFNSWPWSTGVSKSYLELGYYTDGNTRLVAVMGCAVGYALYVQDGEPARAMDARISAAADQVGLLLAQRLGV